MSDLKKLNNNTMTETDLLEPNEESPKETQPTESSSEQSPLSSPLIAREYKSSSENLEQGQEPAQPTIATDTAELPSIGNPSIPPPTPQIEVVATESTTVNATESTSDSISQDADSPINEGRQEKDMIGSMPNIALQLVKELTFGEKLVGKTFNPSNNPNVDKAKALCAELADLLEFHYRSVESTNLTGVVYRGAIDRILDAQMWAVKYLTNQY